MDWGVCVSMCTYVCMKRAPSLVSININTVPSAGPVPSQPGVHGSHRLESLIRILFLSFLFEQGVELENLSDRSIYIYFLSLFCFFGFFRHYFGI